MTCPAHGRREEALAYFFLPSCACFQTIRVLNFCELLDVTDTFAERTPFAITATFLSAPLLLSTSADQETVRESGRDASYT